MNNEFLHFIVQVGGIGGCLCAVIILTGFIIWRVRGFNSKTLPPPAKKQPA